MSYEAQRWASQAVLGPHQFVAKLLLLMLAYHHNAQTGQCNPSLSQLAEETGLSHPAVVKALTTLKAGHWILSLGRVHGYSNWYVFHRESSLTTPIDSKAQRQLTALTVNVVNGDSKPRLLLGVNVVNGDSKPRLLKQGSNKEVEQGSNKEVAAVPEVDTDRIKANAEIYRRAEDLIGTLTPSLSDKIGDAIDQYSSPWILDALSRAEDANARRWDYIEAILKRWAKEGKQNGVHQKHSRAPTDLRTTGETQFTEAKRVLQRQTERQRNNRGPPG